MTTFVIYIYVLSLIIFSYRSEALQSAVDQLNFNFGGQDQVITRVIFSNAGLDPFIHHGIAEYDTWESGVVFLNCKCIIYISLKQIIMLCYF